uniref:Retrovirus-related Pol polyprotein from transposon TNT 1-94 n=1 Tax=Tanacetum cinerariifolium TaxID=118510 RepID=A0A6L2MVB7_TANCI|nr:retrovirus-related Pol polyprotein from transposon TNT 1-94 [Tanacetum cinerariifolium]
MERTKILRKASRSKVGLILHSILDVDVEVPHSETYLNDMENQSVLAMQDFKQPPAVDFTDNEIHNDSNIIPYSQYLQETQQGNVQDTHLQEKIALKEQVDSLEQNRSKQIKENECLLQTFTVFKNKSKEKEDKYMENEINLEKKIKKFDNILFKVGQSAQTVHMLTKPQAFYDNIHKQALGYQNPFYLKKAQRIKPTLYDGIVMSCKHIDVHVIDDEETLILKEESRSRMYEKENDLEAIKQNISHKPIDYEKLNRLTKDFRKRFTPQQELSAEQAFFVTYVQCYHLKKLKFPISKFDNVVKIRTTPNARTEVKQDKAKQPLDNALDFTCKHAQRIQELLVYVRDTCPNVINLSSKKVVVTPKNTVKKVRIVELITSSRNIKQVEISKTFNSNTHVLSPTGLKCSTSNCGSKPTGNKKNDRISQTPSRNMKNKVEAQPRNVNKKNYVFELIRNVDVKQSQLNANSELICATWNRSQLMNFVSKLLGTVRFRNDHIARIMGSKDEAPESIIKCIKNIQVLLNATVRNVRTDNGTEFVNKTLREFYENVEISYQTSVARTPQQNGIFERQN